ncbi:MAG: adenine deaminase [Oscillospiraceae bacterium]|nr:adenine deaminase [Candidatus Ruminococcus equi]
MNNSKLEKLSEYLSDKKEKISVALSKENADVVLKNATYVNVFSNELLTGDIAICNGYIVGIGEYNGKKEYDMTGKILVPGFIDGHIHLESSMVNPCEFARAVVPHGTTTVVTDPHEIANVMGTQGIDYMLQATEGLPLDVCFMLSSCVPACENEENFEPLEYTDMLPYIENERVLGLAEMMNYVGVVNSDESVLSKIVLSEINGKTVDGHAPMLDAKLLNAYITAGIYSDHECYDFSDALEKVRKGQYIMIREGTAANNLDALMPLLCEKYSSRCMFATDDKHPDGLLYNGHIDYIIKKAIKNGADPLITIKVASINAAQYFGMKNKGAIAPSYLADIAVIDNFDDFNIEMVIKSGEVVFDKTLKDFAEPNIDKNLVERAHNTFNLERVTEKSFETSGELGLLGIVENEIVTKNLGTADKIDVDNDILKIACVERHNNTNHIGIGFVKGYMLKSGAVATSVAHDSHNIIVIGCNESDIATAVNYIADNKGGIVIVNNGEVVSFVPLEIAGLMSEEKLSVVNEKIIDAHKKAYELGCNKDIDPFMTMSFLSLPVIPSLRVTTKGVFDVDNWKFL